MTRINAGIHPKQLTDQHCLAEWRELPRIPATILTGKAKITGIPQEFTLNQGHVKFFYDKQRYLFERYQALNDELLQRAYVLNPEIITRNIAHFLHIQQNIPQLWNSFDDHSAQVILKIRISERLSLMKNLKYYKRDIDLAEALRILDLV